METLFSLFCCCFRKSAAPNKVELHAAAASASEQLVKQAAKVDYSNVSGSLKLDGSPGEELATFGAGCYWGTERYIAVKLAKQKPGAILGHAVGFMSPDLDAPANPTYMQVCKGTTTHVEVLHFKFDKTKISFEELVRFFFTFHDPTTLNKQGNDKGFRYASVIFHHNEEQKRVAEMVIKQVQDLIVDKKITSYVGFSVTTIVNPATTFYPAHKGHQMYLEKNPDGYCNHRIRFSWEFSTRKQTDGAVEDADTSKASELPQQTE